MTMTNEQYTEWLFNPTTVAIREKLHIQRSAWQELLSVGETIEDSPGNTAMRTARMVGKIEGLDEFLNLQYPKDETINRGGLMKGVLMTFGEAIKAMKLGNRVCRAGWNGKGIFIRLQEPGARSKMTSPYIYINTMGLETDNDLAPKMIVPWLASQTDMLADDWEIFNYG